MAAADLTLSPEWSFLLSACSAIPKEQRLVDLRSLITPSIQWKSLFALADRNGVQPLLYRALLGSDDAVPAGEMRSLKQGYYANLHKTLLLSRELMRILDHLATHGVEVMPYKGLALAEALYSDITLRQAGDIDLLIRVQDMPQVRSAVGELGYVPHSPLSADQERSYLKSGYECVFDTAEAHNLLEVQWAIQPRFYAVDFDLDGMFQRAMTVTVAEHAMKTPAYADLLLILSVHAAKHVWSRLVWLCDIAQLLALPNLDWKWIAVEARRLGIVRILWVTVLAANRLLQVRIPPDAQASLPQDSASLTLVDELIGHITSERDYDVESIAYFRLMMRLRERPTDRLRFSQRLIFTPGPGEWQAVRLPGPLFPLYRLVRLSRLAARLVRA